MAENTKWRRYSSMVDTGIDVIGRIPSHWEVLPVRRLAVLINGYPFASELFDPANGYPLLRIRDLDKDTTESRYVGPWMETVAVTTNDLLIGMDGDFNVGRWFGKEPALLNQRMCMLKGEPDVIRFLGYALPAHLNRINATTYSTTVKHLSSLQVQRIKVAVPPRSELSQIVRHLDREIDSIDRLIAKQERLIDLLTEKRRAIIHRAVTRGIDPIAPLKNTGVPWIGKAPAHWSVRRLKDVSRLESGHTPSKTIPEYWVDCSIPWVSLNDSKQLATADYITETAVQISQVGMDNSSARLLPADSVVFTRDATIGLAAITTRPMAVSQHIIAWVPTGRVLPLFLLRVLNAMRPFLDFYTAGATIKTIGMEDIRKLTMAVPPLPEQQQILDSLEPELQAIDTLANKCRRAIELLHEHRASLISAVVTGKIRVTEEVPSAEELLAA